MVLRHFERPDSRLDRQYLAEPSHAVEFLQVLLLERVQHVRVFRRATLIAQAISHRQPIGGRYVAQIDEWFLGGKVLRNRVNRYRHIRLLFRLVFV
jgi:hypothetical protein